MNEFKNVDLVKEYKLCQIRGHTPSGMVLTCSEPLNVCKYCNTQYRYETILYEQNTPINEKIEAKND